jgi:hypothetical protein
MPTGLYLQGVGLIDPALALAQTNAARSSYAAGVTAGVIPAGTITGGDNVVLITAATTPGTQTTRSAPLLYADDPTAYPGRAYRLRICNSGANTFTLAGGTGVTISGTATVATNTWRDFHVVYGGTAQNPTVTITNIGLGTYT